MNNVNMNITQMNPLYLEYKQQQNGTFQLLIFGTAFLLGIIGTIGIFLNGSVCYITIKYRYHYPILHSKTGILIALNCFFELLHQSGHIINLTRIFINGIDFIPFQSALFILALSLGGFFAAFIMLFSLSVDRLLAVLFPIFYRNANTRNYIIGHLLLIWIFSLYNYSSMIYASIQYPDFMVTGTVSNMFSAPGILKSTFFVNLSTLFMAICSYIFVGIIVICKIDVNANTNNENLRKLYRSIFLIVFINIGGYFIANLMATFTLFFNFSTFQSWFLNNLTAIGLNIAAASNAPILLLNSSEYQKAYLKEFYRYKFAFFKLIGNKQINAQKNTIIVESQQNQI